MRVMISQPMGGKTEEQIRTERAKVVKLLEEHGHDVIDTVIPNLGNHGNVPLKYLAKSIEFMADADVVFFMDGWEHARGCRIEHQCCIDYDVRIWVKTPPPKHMQ